MGYEEDVFHIHFKSHRCCSPKLLRSAASSLGDLWGPAADRPLCFKGITHFCAPDSGLEGGNDGHTLDLFNVSWSGALLGPAVSLAVAEAAAGVRIVRPDCPELH